MNPEEKNHNSIENRSLTNTPENDFASCLAISLQEHPKLKQIIDLWPKLPEQITTGLSNLIAKYAGEIKTQREAGYHPDRVSAAKAEQILKGL